MQEGVQDVTYYVSLISLIKMGAVDTDVLDKIQARFDQIDVGGDGSISKIEMHAAALFDKFDVDESDELNLEEFILLAARLNYRDRSSVPTQVDRPTRTHVETFGFKCNIFLYTKSPEL